MSQVFHRLPAPATFNAAFPTHMAGRPAWPVHPPARMTKHWRVAIEGEKEDGETLWRLWRPLAQGFLVCFGLCSLFQLFGGFFPINALLYQQLMDMIRSMTIPQPFPG